MFYVYLLHSAKDNGFYIGFSTDLKRRLSEHTRGASLATKSRGPWKFIYYEAYTEREDAEGREKFLKSGAGRRFLRAQLRHYLRVKGFASRGSDHADLDVRLIKPRERSLLRGSTSRPQRLSTELRSLSPSGNRFREQLQALLSQREIMFQLPLHAHPQILRWTYSGEVP